MIYFIAAVIVLVIIVVVLRAYGGPGDGGTGTDIGPGA